MSYVKTGDISSSQAALMLEQDRLRSSGQPQSSGRTTPLGPAGAAAQMVGQQGASMFDTLANLFKGSSGGGAAAGSSSGFPIVPVALGIGVVALVVLRKKRKRT